MKRASFIFFFLLVTCFGSLPAQAAFNKTAFYQAINSQDLQLIDGELKTLNTLDQGAFRGALQMKKSGLLNDAKEKLRLFKEGKQALESAISSDSVNTEYRFLRLMIQEHSPKVLHYNTALKKDAAYINQHYKQASQALQKEILNYSKSSQVLKPENLKSGL